MYSIVTYGFGPAGGVYEVPVYGFYIPTQVGSITMSFRLSISRLRTVELIR